MKKRATKEPQYANVFETLEKYGETKLGLMVNQAWNDDPKRVLFTLARYKFVAKMLSGAATVLEIGCADAFGTRLVQQEVGKLTAVDFDPVFIEDVVARSNPHWPLESLVHDLVASPVSGTFDAAYCLDVLEHIKPEDEDAFLRHMIQSLTPNGVAIIGMPSLESQAFASPQSKAGHVNCKSGPDLKRVLLHHFHNVFLFSMNDEVVHTGFHPMAHYLLGICAGRRDASNQ